MFCHRVYSIVTSLVRHPFFGRVKLTCLVGLVGGCFPLVCDITEIVSTFTSGTWIATVCTVVVTVGSGKSGF